VWWWPTRQIADPTASADDEGKESAVEWSPRPPQPESHKSRIPEDPGYRELSCEENSTESNSLVHIHVI
jgi:hypothetical protein